MSELFMLEKNPARQLEEKLEDKDICHYQYWQQLVASIEKVEQVVPFITNNKLVVNECTLTTALPKDFQSSLPSIEQIEDELKALGVRDE